VTYRLSAKPAFANAALIGASLWLVVEPAHAEKWDVDRVDPELAMDDGGPAGRFAGDLDFGARAGMTTFDGTQLSLGLSAHYYWTIGASLQYDEGLSAGRGEVTRRGSFAFELRPLFLPRFAKDWQRGSDFVNLTLDSLAFGLGAYAETRLDTDESDPGLLLSLGLAVPLLGTAEGLWLGTRGSAYVPGDSERGVRHSLTAYLAWHWLVDSGRTP
jgi:hypothetical protein